MSQTSGINYTMVDARLSSCREGKIIVILVMKAFTRKKSVILRRQLIKVKRMQRSGTEAIRTQIQPSKPNREISNNTNSQNTEENIGQPSEQLFPKRWPLSNRNRTKNNNTRKVKHHRNSDENRQQSTTTNLPHWNDQL